jgi:hypothetical protein
MNISQSGKMYDRVFGFVVTLTGGAALYLLREWVSGMRNRRKTILRTIDIDEAIRLDTDELYSVRYSLLEKIKHMGECHCGRVKFRIRAPKVLNAFDIHSKVRFPRIVIKGEDFENLTDENILSLYPVTNNNGNSIGIHAFCSYCGVHVLYSPSDDPKEVQINVDCLDDKTIEKINVSYYGSSDLVACSLTDNRAKYYSRTGTGAANRRASSVISNLSDSESVSDLHQIEPLDLLGDPNGHSYSHNHGHHSSTRGRSSRQQARDQNEEALLMLEDDLELDECDSGEDNGMGNLGVNHSRGSHHSSLSRSPNGRFVYTPPRQNPCIDEENLSDTSGATTTTYSSCGILGEVVVSVPNTDTPNTALHRRLRTHLYKHVPSAKGKNRRHSSGSSATSSVSEGIRAQQR